MGNTTTSPRTLAHHLAAALVTIARHAAPAAEAARDSGLLMRDSTRPAPPPSFDALADMVESRPGIGFRPLMDELVPGPAAQQAAFEDLIETARGLTDPELTPPHVIAGMTVGIDMVAAAARGNAQAKSLVDEHLAAYALTTRRTGLVDALQRIAAGDVDRDMQAGRDPLETAILQEVFSRIDDLRNTDLAAGPHARKRLANLRGCHRPRYPRLRAALSLHD